MAFSFPQLDMLAVVATPFLAHFEGLFLVLSIWQAQVKDDIFMS